MDIFIQLYEHFRSSKEITAQRLYFVYLNLFSDFQGWTNFECFSRKSKFNTLVLKFYILKSNYIKWTDNFFLNILLL